MLRKAIAGAALAALMAGCAGLPTIDVSSVNTTGVNTTAPVSTAPAPPLPLEYANWSDFGESPPLERTSSAMMLEDDHADWSDFGESPREAVR